jgi:adenylate cyclase
MVTTLACALVFSVHAADKLTVPVLDRLELVSLDTRLVLQGTRQPRSDDIVIVGLDDETRRRTPLLFQQREGWAKLIDRLAAYEPKAVAIDAMFSSPEVSLPQAVIATVRDAHEELEGEVDPTPGAQGALEALAAVLESLRGDERLAEAIEQAGHVYLAIFFLLAEGANAGDAAPAGAPEPAAAAAARYAESVVVARSWRQRPREARSAVPSSMPDIAARARAAGFVNIIVDEDGGTRRVPAVLARAGRYYMPLGLAMALAHTSERASYLTGEPYVTAGDRKLPVGDRADFQLSFLGPGETFPHISAADVLDGNVPEEALAGKLVFVGYTDAARDKVRTPFDPAYPGVEVHATLTHNILHDELLRRAGAGATFGSILGLGALIAIVQLRRIRQRRAWLAAAAGLGSLVGYALIAHGLLAWRGLIVEVAAPALSCLLVAGASLSAALVTEGREKARLKSAFSQYVAGALVERILADPSRAVLGGVRRELTVLFSDVRGFSEIAEDLEPEVLSAFMNEYLTPMTEVVMREGGMLDKYIGDALMAVYGAPLAQRDHAERACTTALAMLAALEPLNEAWRARGLPELEIGVGINSGPMAVGNMGSEARFDYTVLGDAVNLGARLESLTKDYRVRVLCGERTVEFAGARFVFRELDFVRVKGRAGAARLFELVDTAQGARLSAEELELYADALAAYRERRFDDAELMLSRFLDRVPEDGPAQVMRARCQTLRKAPPPADWDGVYMQRSK